MIDFGSQRDLEDYIKATLTTDDLLTKHLTIDQLNLTIYYIDTLTDIDKLNQQILSPLLQEKGENLLNTIHSIASKQMDSADQAVKYLLRGSSVISLEEQDGQLSLWNLDTGSAFHRSISEPVGEKIIEGGHEGLVERLSINLHLIRKKITNKDLIVRYYRLGTHTDTEVALVYIQSLVDQDVLDEVTERLANIETDSVISQAVLEEIIEDNPLSLFPMMLNTERVDRVAANLAEGRFAILIDGLASVIILPVTFFSLYQSPDDYNARWINGSFIRLIRIAGFLIATTLPAFYISVISFHFELIPNELITSIHESVQHIPYPPLIEAFIMELTIELLREAGIRLHTAIGQSIGIVGGLVIGDAVVRAGLVSNIMIIVVALTAISSFVVPSNELRLSVRILRFPLMVLSSIFGLLGITFGFTILLIYLCKLESFGKPFFYPVSPLRLRKLKDSLARSSFTFKRYPKG
ncbi:spore germination protein [Brevibacillus dissolubilis]|uniref:spore germination protein n=1 Tax=Brevibacillus dissolubilis TaxID=1844116 RepID=UPI001117A19D|nr:spore germination protein [Brevibacillus dissolubilis]